MKNVVNMGQKYEIVLQSYYAELQQSKKLPFEENELIAILSNSQNKEEKLVAFLLDSKNNSGSLKAA